MPQWRGAVVCAVVSTQASGTEIPDGPRLGGLLRLASARVHDVMLERLHAAGFGDITRATIPIFYFPPPLGVRPADVARKMALSRQAFNSVLRRMESAGYVERRPDAQGRPLVWLTGKGEAATAVLLESALEIETDLVAAIGRDAAAAVAAALHYLAGLPST